MPIYAYKCESCGLAKDVLQKMSDPQLTVCPQCGAAAFKKQVTAAGFQLKGSGWYVTDFKGGSAASAVPAPAGATADSGAATSGAAATAATPAAVKSDAAASTPAASAKTSTSGTAGNGE